MTHDLKSWADWYVSCSGGNVPHEAQAAYDALAEIARLQAELAAEKALADRLYDTGDSTGMAWAKARDAYRKARGL